ncbi:protein required for growth at high temperature [Scheffersomyces xylosifermentans]|uniref:protein required for growth at high temperature n=1 Tax=Scheffersomyces xylosifermentans TaxID=1304137 RepID=UPI00315DDE43
MNRSKLGQCTICRENVAKYKCPKCDVVYCSIPCFKDVRHTDRHLESEEQSKQQQDKQSQKMQLSKEEEGDNIVESSELPTKTPSSIAPIGSAKGAEENQSHETEIFQKIVSDPQIQGMLKIKSLQFHLLTLIKILDDPTLFKSSNDQILTHENRLSIMNLKLNDLRVGGIEENELVEEFISRVIELYDHHFV